MIPKTFLADLIARIDIVEVVGRYVQLKKAGVNYMGLCPFHQEKSPSFTVSPTKQFYHCFGCGAHGTAIGFLMAYSGLGFVEAVKDLAHTCGLVVPEEKNTPLLGQSYPQANQTIAMSEVMRTAAQYYKKQLKNTIEAIDYLKKRGLSGAIAAQFGLGYAPSGWDNLRAVFTDYEATVLVESGLVISKKEPGQTHRRYDRFRERIIFPIKNSKGQVIGLGGRILEQGEPKYLNSPETLLFQKGHELYGLFEARQAIREAGYVLVVEGYMDVLALAQFGFFASVATLGTACTAIHIQKLLRQTDNIIFSFDGDAAGKRAAARALETCLPLVSDNKTIQFIFLPDNHDPDSYMRAYGKTAFDKMIADAMPLSQFLVSVVCEGNQLTEAEGRARVLFNAKALLKLMPPCALRVQIVRLFAQLTQTTLEDIEAIFELPQTKKMKRTPYKIKRSAPVGLERQIMRILLHYPQLAVYVNAHALESMEKVLPDQGLCIKDLIVLIREMGSQVQFAALLAHFKDEHAELDEWLLDVVGGHQDRDLEVSKEELLGAIHQITIQSIKAQQAKLIEQGLKTQADKDLFYALKHQLASLHV